MKETKFKDTEIGKIPEEWEVRTINSFCSVKTGPFGSMLHAEDYVAKGTPIVTTEHFKNGILPLVGKDIPQIGIEDLKRMSSYTLTKDDIVFSRVGSVDINALVTVRQKGWLFSGRVLRVRPFKQTDSLYLHYGLLKHSVRSDIVSRAVGLTMASINTKILGETELSLPPLNEQRRIASALTSIDNLISSLGKLIEKKKNIKQGAMQQLLTGQIRLKGFSEPWVKRKLGDNATIQRGGSPRPIEAYLTTNRDGINWIKIGDVRPNDKFIRHTAEKIIPEGISHSRQVYKGDFILSNSMSFGRPYILDIDGCIHDGWLVIKDYSNTYDMDFLYYILSSNAIFEQYIAMAAGSSVKNLNKEKVANVILFAPQSLAEQRAIATILTKMDNEITDLETKKAKYEAIKQGMMQQLLTGKIRLIS